MRGQLTSELKAKRKFNDDSAPLHQTQIGPLTLLLWSALKGGIFCCFAHLNCCCLVVFYYGWGTKGKSVLFSILFYYYYFWELMYICCGLKDHCVSMKKAVAELRLYLDIPLYPYTPWRNCWETVESMDWLLQSKSANDCAFVHVCFPTSIVMKTFLTPISCRPYIRSCDLLR